MLYDTDDQKKSSLLDAIFVIDGVNAYDNLFIIYECWKFIKNIKFICVYFVFDLW